MTLFRVWKADRRYTDAAAALRKVRHATKAQPVPERRAGT